MESDNGCICRSTFFLDWKLYVCAGAVILLQLCLHLAFRSLFSINKAPNDESQGSKVRELLPRLWRRPPSPLSQTTINLKERLGRLHKEHHMLKKAVLSLIRILVDFFSHACINPLPHLDDRLSFSRHRYELCGLGAIREAKVKAQARTSDYCEHILAFFRSRLTEVKISIDSRETE